MKRELSLFIDESGDFGFKKGASDFYFLTFVFHEQSKSIGPQLVRIKNEPCFHAGPLIRRETPYENLSRRERQKIFTIFSFFVSSLPISIRTFFWVKKNYASDILKLEKAMAKDVLAFFEVNQSYFSKFDELKIYYDKGQLPISRLLNLCFARLPFPTVFKEQVKPEKYRLFQVAHFVSTIKLYEAKMKRKELSKSEQAFVDSRHFKKVYLATVNRKDTFV